MLVERVAGLMEEALPHGFELQLLLSAPFQLW